VTGSEACRTTDGAVTTVMPVWSPSLELSTADPDLYATIRQVAEGDAVFSPRLAGFVLDAFADGAQATAPAPSFDPEFDQLTNWAAQRRML